MTHDNEVPPRSFVVAPCNLAEDWCVRRATPAELDDPEGPDVMTLPEARAAAAQLAEAHGCKWFDRSAAQDELEAAVQEAFHKIDQEKVEKITAVLEYAKHLREGGDPSWVRIYRGKFTKAGEFAELLDAARRRDAGRPPNPFNVGTDAYKLFDRMYGAGVVTVADLTNGRFQVESVLKPYTLKKAGWSLAKSKVGGKVAYELVRVIDPEAVEA